MTLIAQISDLHVYSPGKLAYGVVDTNSLVAEAIKQLSKLTPQPDAVVASGDLVHKGTPEDYEVLKTILAPLNCPLYLMPGNHDQRDNLRRAFPSHPYLPGDINHLSYVVEAYPICMIMLDSIVPGEGGGCVDAERLSWLEQQLLAAPQTPTLIFIHHPPFATGIPWMDRNRFQGHGALANLIRQHPQVKRVSCGHLHRGIYRAWAGTVASSQPSLVHQGAIDFAPESPSQFAMEPPAYQLHIWTGETLISHTMYVGQFDGPYRFSDGKPVVAADASSLTTANTS